MKIAFRWKLTGSYLLLAVAMGATIYGYLTPKLESSILAETREGLLGELRLARLATTRDIRDLHRDSPAVAAAIAAETRARVTIISAGGTVVGDSEVNAGDLKDLENHLDRPEVQEALRTGEGTAIRYSGTLRTAMLYTAVPFATGGERGVLRLALPLASLEKAKHSLHAVLGLSLLLAAAISLILGFILSNVMSRSLRTMATIATAIGKGEFGRRIPVRSRDEVGMLAEVMNDMAVRIEAQVASLGAEKSRLDAILCGMGEGVMVADSDGTVTLVNPAFRLLFDLQEEVTGKGLIAITRHPTLHEAFREVIRTHEEHVREIVLHLRVERTLLTHWVPLKEEGGIVAVFLDITELKKLEVIRRDFVANVSHELRTPVTVIKGYAESLLDGVLTSDPERAEQFVTVIQRHAERLGVLVSDLLTLSELESGKLALKLSPLSLEGPVASARVLLAEKAREKGVAIDTAGFGNVPPVTVDRGRIEQVVINLLDNAIKYTPSGGSVRITAEDRGEVVSVTVSDTGPGIPASSLPRIFERFYCVDAARSRELGGTGLGLSIVKHIVQLHGGSVAVESSGQGSTFSFTLPKKQPQLPP